MKTQVLLPELGAEPGHPITLSVWFADVGDAVYEGDRLVEILVNGATFDVSSPATGTLAEIFAFPDDALQPGQLLALVASEAEAIENDATEDSTPSN